MAEKTRYVLQKPARLLYANITEKSAPPGVNAEPKFSGTFGIEQQDFDAIVKIMVGLIKTEMGSFSGKPDDYYLACSSGATAARRVLASAELNCRGKSQDEAFKIMEKATKRADMYKGYAGVLNAASKFEVELARLDGGKVIDIAQEPHILAQAGKDYFYSGAYVAPCVEFQPFKRKTLDAKDGVTAFLKQCLYVRKGERLGGSGPEASEVFKSYAGYSDVDPTAMAPSNEDGDGSF